MNVVLQVAYVYGLYFGHIFHKFPIFRRNCHLSVRTQLRLLRTRGEVGERQRLGRHASVSDSTHCIHALTMLFVELFVFLEPNQLHPSVALYLVN